MNSSGRERFEVIDLLRFGAAVAVMIYHFTASGAFESAGHTLVAPRDIFPSLEPVTHFGFLGVDLFFLISGFVILSSALDRTALQFAVSRFSRIYPTYWAGIAFSLLCLAINLIVLRVCLHNIMAVYIDKSISPDHLPGP